MEKLLILSLVREKDDKVPLYPATLFLVMILINPPTPSPSYLAEGVVITSILDINAPGNALIASFILRANMDVSRPLSSTRKFDLPFTLILSSPSTVMNGVLRRMSKAVSVLLAGSSSTFITILSSDCSTIGRREVTTTSFNVPLDDDSKTG